MKLSPVHVEVEGNRFCRHQWEVAEHYPSLYFRIYLGADLKLKHYHCPHCGRLEEHRFREEELTIPN